MQLTCIIFSNTIFSMPFFIYIVSIDVCFNGILSAALSISYLSVILSAIYVFSLKVIGMVHVYLELKYQTRLDHV